MKNTHIQWRYRFPRWRVPLSLLLCTIIALVLAGLAVAQGSSPERIQSLSGHIEPGGVGVYEISGLEEGDLLTASMIDASGDLDPFLALVPAGTDLVALYDRFNIEARRLESSDGEDLASGINRERDEMFLVWDDDSGAGYSAAFSFDVPVSGDYLLLTYGALSTFGRGTSGGYDLLLGINAPDLLEGANEPVGEPFAERIQSPFESSAAVEEATGELSAERPVVIHELTDLQPQDTVSVFVEATSGNLRPIVILRDYGGKPLDAANLASEATQAAFEHTVDEAGRNYVIEIESGFHPNGELTEGSYRLLVGINAEDVLTGDATPTVDKVLQAPIDVEVGVKLQQIIEVDTQNETFNVVGDIRMDWRDPALAFNPDSCHCDVKVFTENDFVKFLDEVDSRWPDFTFFNQQGNRWTQNKIAAIWPDGRARYYERFTTNFQTDFDFRQFPFDTQTFPIYTQLVFSDETYRFSELPGYTEISGDNGEDEFIITGFDTEISSVPSDAVDADNSRFSFSFTAPRHLDYYIFQIFVPIGLIILISWFTFFLRDYTRRIEAASANILLFIAFSFSLSDNYPRLGYLTFLDAIMLITFVVNTLVVLYNVYLKQLESDGQAEKADNIDRYLDWIYPISYILLVGFVVFLYFGRG